MRSFFYVILHPLQTLNLWLENDPNASIFDVLYLLTVFSAFGIWLVFDRYQKARNNAVPFRHNPPEVSTSILPCCLSDTSSGSRSRMEVPTDPRRESQVTSHRTRAFATPFHGRTRLYNMLRSCKLAAYQDGHRGQ